MATRRPSDSENWEGIRKGGGRPRKYRNPVVVSVPLPQDVVDILDRMAEEASVAEAPVLVKRIEIIRRLLAKNKELSAAFKAAEFKAKRS